MLLNPKIQKAIYVATHQHRDQKRKHKEVPFIVHPFSVAWILSEQVNDVDIIAAALLHDVVEDTEGYTFHDMQKDFGKKVVDIVKSVTEDKTLPWRERKEKYMDGLKEASQEALMLCVADKIHNLASLREEIEENGGIHWGKHHKTFDDTKWYYEAVYETVSPLLNHEILLDEFKRELEIFQ